MLNPAQWIRCDFSEKQPVDIETNKWYFWLNLAPTAKYKNEELTPHLKT